MNSVFRCCCFVRALWVVLLVVPLAGVTAPNPLQVARFTDAMVTGSSGFAQQTLHFHGTYALKPQTKAGSAPVERFVITLSIGEKQWITTIDLDAAGAATLQVTADKVTLSAAERGLLAESAQRLFAHSTEEPQHDTLLWRLLTQMVAYWSKSPPNFVISSGTLGS